MFIYDRGDLDREAISFERESSVAMVLGVVLKQPREILDRILTEHVVVEISDDIDKRHVERLFEVGVRKANPTVGIKHEDRVGYGVEEIRRRLSLLHRFVELRVVVPDEHDFLHGVVAVVDRGDHNVDVERAPTFLNRDSEF